MMEYKGAHDQVIFQDVLDVCSTYITKPESIDLIKKAYDFIMVKHEGQKRKSGEPYTIHLIWVAYILSTLETGPITIAAGLLHDVMEDCDVSHEEMVERFGEEITTLVEGVTKINKMPFKDEADVYAENHRKIYIAMAKDIRVILIKLADRLHNMRTLEYMRPDKQQRISRETLEVYAPIAHRLGINDIRIELEDLCLYYLDPKAYKEISDLLEEKRSERRESVDKMMQSVKQLLDENHIDYRMKGRAFLVIPLFLSVHIIHIQGALAHVVGIKDIRTALQGDTVAFLFLHQAVLGFLLFIRQLTHHLIEFIHLGDIAHLIAGKLIFPAISDAFHKPSDRLRKIGDNHINGHNAESQPHQNGD